MTCGYNGTWSPGLPTCTRDAGVKEVGVVESWEERIEEGRARASGDVGRWCEGEKDWVIGGGGEK